MEGHKYMYRCVIRMRFVDKREAWKVALGADGMEQQLVRQLIST